MPRTLFMLASVLAAFSISTSSPAGTVSDVDGDLVPDPFDNCLHRPNGPVSSTGNQVDTDGDGFGNHCDCDFDQDGIVAGSDIVLLFQNFGGTDPLYDIDGDGQAGMGADVVVCFGVFNEPPGPSGLACADPTGATAPCTP